MKTAEENPEGLHQRYAITKADGSPCDPNATYFVLRLDEGGSDYWHIRACRQAVWSYCNEIGLPHSPHLEQLRKDLLELLRNTAPDLSDRMEGPGQV